MGSWLSAQAHASGQRQETHLRVLQVLKNRLVRVEGVHGLEDLGLAPAEHEGAVAVGVAFVVGGPSSGPIVLEAHGVRGLSGALSRNKWTTIKINNLIEIRRRLRHDRH